MHSLAGGTCWTFGRVSVPPQLTLLITLNAPWFRRMNPFCLQNRFTVHLLQPPPRTLAHIHSSMFGCESSAFRAPLYRGVEPSFYSESASRIELPVLLQTCVSLSGMPCSVKTPGLSDMLPSRSLLPLRAGESVQQKSKAPHSLFCILLLTCSFKRKTNLKPWYHIYIIG